jgi:hypothetical protein
MSTPDQGRRITRGSCGCRGPGGIDHTHEAVILPLLAAKVVLAPSWRICSWLTSASVRPRWDRWEPWWAPGAVKTVGGLKTRLIPLGTAIDWTMLVPIDLAPGPIPAVPLRHGRKGCGLDHDIVADA